MTNWKNKLNVDSTWAINKVVPSLTERAECRSYENRIRQCIEIQSDVEWCVALVSGYQLCIVFGGYWSGHISKEALAAWGEPWPSIIHISAVSIQVVAIWWWVRMSTRKFWLGLCCDQPQFQRPLYIMTTTTMRLPKRHQPATTIMMNNISNWSNTKINPILTIAGSSS